ncbi:hypothetical protein [Tenacibaculum haliotis]|uniref:hypothetical protein n=1 Tax=Tenacibaculum haliotis TaxID=1888914 RepID=UPI0021AFE9DF|nr:hypothetical protein [Tenacibaculum haliotis]MCT4698216.1 hypothetical protein [Tenacibaculum haliotis]
MKNKKINFLKLGIFLFGVSLLFWNCESEINLIENKTSIPTISESKTFLLNNNNSFSARGASNTFIDRIDWNNSKEEYYKENTELLYSPIQLNATKAKSFVASIKVNGIIDNRIITLLYDNDNSPKIFSGTILIHTKEGRLTEFYNYKNGKKEEKYIVNETDSSSQARSSNDYDCYDIEYLQWLMENNDDPMYILAPCMSLNASIETGDSGSNGNSWYEPIDFLNDDFNSGDDNINNNDLTGGGGNWYTPSCGAGYILDENNNCVEDDKIDSTRLTGKEKCLNDSLTKNGNTFVKDLLANFNGNSEFDINISSKYKVFRNKTTIEINGKTIYKPGTTLINIHISTNQMSNRNSLSCIRTLLHEYIHADMYRKLNTSKKPTGGDIDFKQTYNDFDNNNFKASPQHETMAKLYIGEMKNALKEAHNKLIPNEVKYYKENYPSNTLDNIYDALAWQGLKEHKVKAWLDKGNDTININKTINTKLSGLTKEFCK